MKSKTISLFLFVFLTLFFFLSPLIFNTGAYAIENVVYFDNFNDGIINSKLQVKNFTLEDSGSFSPYTELDAEEIEGLFKISGVGTIDILPLDGQLVGWIGKSVILNNELETGGETIILESFVKIIDHNSRVSAHLTLEFDSDNRVLLDVGEIDETKFSRIWFDEFDTIRCIGNAGSPLCPFFLYDFPDNEFIKLKLEYNSSTNEVKGYINNELIAQGFYSGLKGKSKAGFAAVVRLPGQEVDVRFDDFKVSGKLANQVLPVPDIKQYSNPWGSQIYNFANNWFPSNPSIARWGCAITSATMVLNYHGDNTDPGTLNEWLKNNNGYTRNGAVLWPSISKYSLNDPDTPTLEFAYLPFSNALVKSEVDSNRPPILKLLNATYGGNHFIVAKGYGNPDIFVNDPGNASNDTLSEANSYWGDTVKLGRFTPSNTDLSYITLFVDDDVELEVVNPSGNILGNEYYFKEGPMLDPENPNSDSGVEILNAFYYPKPPDGLYKVSLSGEGNFQLDSYLHDQEGNVQLQNFLGQLENGQEKDYYIFISDNLKFTFPTDTKKGIEILLSDLEEMYKTGDISKNGVFVSLKQLLENALKQIQKENPLTAEILLNVALERIKFFTPKFINEASSNELQAKIQILLDSI